MRAAWYSNSCCWVFPPVWTLLFGKLYSHSHILQRDTGFLARNFSVKPFIFGNHEFRIHKISRCTSVYNIQYHSLLKRRSSVFLSKFNILEFDRLVPLPAPQYSKVKSSGQVLSVEFCPNVSQLEFCAWNSDKKV